MFIIFLVVIVIAIALAQMAVYKRFVFRKLTYERRFKQKHCFRGDEIELVEGLSNAKWLPIPWLKVESQLSTHLRFSKQDNFSVSSGELSQNHSSFFTLGGYMKLTRTHRLTPTRRGWYKLSTVSMTGGDVLGSVHCYTQIPLEDELIVYPRPAAVPFHELPSQSLQGEQLVKRFIIPDPFVIAGSREYQSGDSMKQVNWKATARMGSLQVHQYDYTADKNVLICLNAEDKEGMWRSVSNELAIEQGIEWAAGVAEAAIAQGMDVGFTTNMQMPGNKEHTHVEADRGHEHLILLFEVMAKLLIERAGRFIDLLKLEALKRYTNRDIVVITSYWNDELELAAHSLRHNGNTVTVWLLPRVDQAGAPLSAASNDTEGRSAS